MSPLYLRDAPDVRFLIMDFAEIKFMSTYTESRSGGAMTKMLPDMSELPGTSVNFTTAFSAVPRTFNLKI